VARPVELAIKPNEEELVERRESSHAFRKREGGRGREERKAIPFY